MMSAIYREKEIPLALNKHEERVVEIEGAVAQLSSNAHI